MCRVQDDSIHIILTSVDSEAGANMLAHGLIDAHLAACVHISAPGQSVYRWQGAIQHDGEYYLSIKTSAPAVEQAVCWLEKHHPYDVPEIIRLQGTAAEAYGNWVQAQTMITS